MSANNGIEIITIGREILDGRVIDTNSVFLAQTLKQKGLIVRWAQRVDDEIQRIIQAFEIASRRSSIVLITGGLGPTLDDLTSQAAAEFLNEDWVSNPEALLLVEGFFKKNNREFLEVQKKQALLPTSAKILKNFQGSAPGFNFQKNSCQFYCMPGVPREMKAMFLDAVLPHLPTNSDYRSFQWATQFTSEGELQKRLNPIYKILPPHFEITYRTRFPENHIGLHGEVRGDSEDLIFEEIKNKIAFELGTDVFSCGTELMSLEEIVVEVAQKNSVKILTVESCTGGLIYHRLTNVAGSSAVVLGSLGVYSNELKLDLGVPPDVFSNMGAVSEACAVSLAENGLKKMKAIFPNTKILCVSTTGIAGPAGGSSQKPVGTCHIAIASSFSATQHLPVSVRKDLPRLEIKSAFAQNALEGLRQSILNLENK